MSRRPRATIQELREAVQSLPHTTRVAMLEGLDAGPIIAGAYTSDDGICPMLAAHRAGGRCSAAFFADAWDRFAFRDERGRRGVARRVNERELRILRSHLEASLLDEDRSDATLARALHEHRELRARRQSTLDPTPIADPATPATPVTPATPATAAAGGRPRPGDRDRAAELRGRAGWAWTRLFRRYDDYEAALVHLQAADPGAAPDRRPTRADRTSRAASGDCAEPVNV